MTTVWTTNVWVQERNVLTVSGFASGMTRVVIATTSPSGYSASYTIPASGSVQVDMSDLVRLYDTGTFTITEYNDAGTAGTTLTRTWLKVGLINPRNVIAPENEIGVEFMLKVFPPSMMLKPATGAQIAFEISDENSYQFATGRVKELPSESVQNFARSVTIDSDTEAVEFWHLTDLNYGTVVLKDLEECKQYATVEWVSFSGATRRHTFEVVNCKTETIDAVSLQNLQNFYDERKGRRDGFVLRLENLDRYDFWYYADLITSSSVIVTLPNMSARKVQVVTKSVEIPNTDEGELNTLEIEINYAKYDTL